MSRQLYDLRTATIEARNHQPPGTVREERKSEEESSGRMDGLRGSVEEQGKGTQCRVKGVSGGLAEQPSVRATTRFSMLYIALISLQKATFRSALVSIQENNAQRMLAVPLPSRQNSSSPPHCWQQVLPSWPRCPGCRTAGRTAGSPAARTAGRTAGFTSCARVLAQRHDLRAALDCGKVRWLKFPWSSSAGSSSSSSITRV